MPALSPFRALRYVPSRVDLAACLSDGAEDPRAVKRLADPQAPATRTRLFLSEWRRAGILSLDEQPSITVVKRRGEDDSEHYAFFALLGDSPSFGVQPQVIAFADDTGRIKRTLSSAADREPDAQLTLAGESLEAFAVDDETAAARLATLIGEVDGDGLAFFVDKKDEWLRVPVGLAMLPGK